MASGREPGTPPPSRSAAARRLGLGNPRARGGARRWRQRKRSPSTVSCAGSSWPGLAVTLGSSRLHRRPGGLCESEPQPAPRLVAAGDAGVSEEDAEGREERKPRARGRPAAMSLAAEAFVSQIAATEPWPENATLYQQLKGEQILLSDNAASLAVQAFLQMCNLPIKVVCRANAEYMSPSGKVPFIHVGNQVVSELGPIVQFVKAKGHSLSDGLDEVQKAEMKAYMELVNNMLLTAELYLQWCDEATVGEITHARYGSPYPWPLNHILAYQKQWEVRRKMKAIGWGNKTLDQVLEDVDQCCQALSQRLGTQPYFFNKQPTELDALVFGHLYTILTTQLTNDELSEKVKNYSNLLAFCRRIEQHYFEDRGKVSSSVKSS
ncbi:metaxin-2 [Callorhinus ursinus]|uniref:Metaxin-2 n=1 Tax=Callorhinus ursinus TaxID=34884 RepID=A0A3Q7MI84_CALUR|nr:metaxin-2 [Callorhinus ursinus]